MTKRTVATMAVVGVLAAVSFTALGDDRDKKTIITTKESLLVPGKVLPPGKYVMKLMESPNRNIVTIYNEDQNELQTMFIAFPNYKVKQTSGTELTFWETPAGSPKAIRAWFWPGDNFGQEFAYPKQLAETLARENNGAKVPSYEADANATLSESQLAQVNVENKPEADTSANTSTAAATTSSSSSSAVDRSSSESVPERNPVAEARQSITPAPEPVNEPQSQARSDDTVLAQNNPTPNPVAPNTANDTTTSPSELPQTASPMSWVLLVGLISLSFAVVMRRQCV